MTVLVYSNQDDNVKRFKTRRYYLPKEIDKNYYEQPIDSEIKRYEEIRKLTTVQGKNYATGCLLDYEYIKNHYRLIANHLSEEKELNADPKAFKQIEFVGQLENIDIVNADVTQSIFILTILEKIKETRLNFLKEV